MGLFDLFKKKDVQAKQQPLAYWEENSYMVLIPYDRSNCGFDEGMLDRISGIDGVKIVSFSMPHETMEGQIELTYQGETYNIHFFWSDFSLPQMMRVPNQFFTEEELSAVQNADCALTFYMKFGKQPKVSYHLQIKLAARLMPDMAGVMDESAEKMLCPRWVKQIAQSYVLPPNDALFLVQAVQGKKEVWLHTHGLARCGLSELEILQSSKDDYNDHYYVISTLAGQMLDGNAAEGEPAYIARMTAGEPLVVKYLPWPEGLEYYKNIETGGLSDRKESHNTKSSIIMACSNVYNEKEGTASPNINVLEKVTNMPIGENPMFFISREETRRMSMLAREKYECLKYAYNAQQGGKECNILVKVGLKTDDPDQNEHIWFELLGFEGDDFIGELTQDPFYVDYIKKGDKGKYSVDDITDWIIYTPEYNVRPETAYLMM